MTLGVVNYNKIYKFDYSHRYCNGTELRLFPVNGIFMHACFTRTSYRYFNYRSFIPHLTQSWGSDGAQLSFMSPPAKALHLSY